MKLKSLFLGLSAVLLAAGTMVSCKTVFLDNNKLSVKPSETLSFEAKGNEDVTVEVTTDAGAWEYKAPEWVVAKKEGNLLKVNVSENTGEERSDRLVFTADNAQTVMLNVYQKAPSDMPITPAAVTLNNKMSSETLSVGSSTAIKVSLSISEAVGHDVEVQLFVDEAYLREYNFLNDASLILFPKEKVTIPNEGKIVIPAGKTESDEFELTVDPASMTIGVQNLLPLYVKPVSGALVKQAACRINYILMKPNPRSVRNVCYFEVNDTNPLNALEYVLADGTPFFDAVILFAANINYKSDEDLVYLHNNPNVQALLNESEVYLQPLRKAGIKVYLGLLGNHDAAGLAQLSDWGAKEWAKEVAQACRDYKLDGVNLDDEYSASPILTNKWFAPHSAAAGARLMYELKMALKEKCPWPTEVSYFRWGALGNLPEVVDNGVTHKQSEFVDFCVANYGGAAPVYGDLTSSHCSGVSVELNRGYLPSGDWTRSVKDGGYGWCMWFAFDPSGTGSIDPNLYSAKPLFQKASRDFYGQELKNPDGVYKKISEGKYDPKRYPL